MEAPEEAMEAPEEVVEAPEEAVEAPEEAVEAVDEKQDMTNVDETVGDNQSAGGEVKEVIELNLAVSGQLNDEYDNALTESEEEDKGTDYEPDEPDRDLGNPVVDLIPSAHSLPASLLEATQDRSDGDFIKESETQQKSFDEEKNNFIEEVSQTDSTSADRRDQEVQSEQTAVEDLLPEEYLLSSELFDRNSMINALFNKSPVPHDKSEHCRIQVTIFLPNNQSVTKLYMANTNIYELKRDIGETVEAEPDKLLISLLGNTSGEYIGDWTPLIGIPPNTAGGLILNLSFKHDFEVKNVVRFPSIETYAPIITVRRVRIEDIYEKEKVVTVVTEDISYVKEWLGGFKNVKTGQMYHNAATETRFWDRKPKVETPVERNSRNVQTHLPYLTKYTQVHANKTTQMWRPDHYIQSVNDKIISSKPYVEYDLRTEQQERWDAAVKIQRWYRREVTRRNIRKAFSKLIELIRSQRQKRSAAEAALNSDKILYLLGITFPTTRNDFFNLYSIIVMWWKKEFNEIAKIKNISERRAAYYNLLLDEIELLSALERQKIKSKAEALQRRDMKLLEETSRPIIRQHRKKNMTIVETLEVQRAREIKEVYMSYSRTDLDKKERIQVILSLLNIVETFDEIDYTRDLIKLMRREIDMISMGIDEVYLQGLRKRIEEGLFHFVRDKEFNPQAKNFRPIHFPRVQQRSYRCKGCRKLKTPADFPVHVRLTSYQNCRSCNWMQMTAHQVLNISPYASILKLLRAREITKCPRSIYCFLIQPFGAYFIINTIWNGKSAISEAMNLPELRLCRWDNKKEWSPWNSILLTVEEAEVHERIYNNSEVYEDDFIQAVKIKHIETKFHFKIMEESENYCVETGLWDSALDENIYQHMFHRKEALKPVDPIFKPPLTKAFVNSNHPNQIPPCSRSKN